MPSCRRSAAWLVVVGACAWSGAARAAERWVDTGLAADCTDYDVATRQCGAGDQLAHATLASADAAAAPGDIVSVRAADFHEPFVVGASGSEGAPVVFRAHPGETVTFSQIASDDGAISIDGRAWLEISGFIIEDVGSWVRVVDSHHIVLRGNLMARASIEGTRGSVKLLRSDDCAVIDNVLAEANDNLTIVDARRTLVRGNLISTGRHSLISVRCSEYNVFRGNVLINQIQKAAEVYDCEGSSSDDPVLFEATRRNLWEHNEFAGTAPSAKSYDYNAMQLAGQDGLVRRNVYHDNLGGGVHLQVYPEEALANHGNRVYHNTFYKGLCFALAGSPGPGDGYYDNVVAANLLYMNADCAGGGEQLSPGDPVGAVFGGNVLATREPGFVDADGGDFSLVDASPVIDVGPWLTRTVGAGEGTEMTVVDARWFFDGFGVAGEQGDVVQLEGDAATARVVGVDLAAGKLTLDAPLVWSDEQGLALAYAGVAPDPGAYEHGLPAPGDETGGETTDGSGGEDTGGSSEPGVTSGGEEVPTTGAATGGAETTGSPATTTAEGTSGAAEDAADGCGCRSGPRGLWLVAIAGLCARRRPRRCGSNSGGFAGRARQ